MKKYEWHNSELHKKSDKYDKLSLGICAIGLIVGLFLTGYNSNFIYVAVALFGVGFVFLFKSWGLKNKDKEEKNKTNV